jgi:hypothetical protein
MTPFFACPFHHRMVLVDTVSSPIAMHFRKPSSSVLLHKFAGKHSHIFPPVWEVKCLGTHCMKLQNVADGTVRLTMANVQHGAHFIHLNTTICPNDPFGLCNYPQCYFTVSLVQSSGV